MKQIKKLIRVHVHSQPVVRAQTIEPGPEASHQTFLQGHGYGPLIVRWR